MYAGEQSFGSERVAERRWRRRRGCAREVLQYRSNGGGGGGPTSPSAAGALCVVFASGSAAAIFNYLLLSLAALVPPSTMTVCYGRVFVICDPPSARPPGLIPRPRTPRYNVLMTYTLYVMHVTRAGTLGNGLRSPKTILLLRKHDPLISHTLYTIKILYDFCFFFISKYQRCIILIFATYKLYESP